MPWKHMGIILKEGKAWSDASKVQHPANWALWSDSEKLAIGMEWVDPPAYFDDRFYWGVGLEKSLADSSDGTIGLKTTYKNQIKETAHSLLKSTDWYVIRKYEDSKKEIPTKIINYRAAVRDAADTIEKKIDAASNMKNFIKLFDSADANGITEINRWPEEV
jgi:hypothetical protein